jgi:hypothetical protein
MMNPHDLGPAFVAGPRFLLTEYVARVRLFSTASVNCVTSAARR